MNILRVLFLIVTVPIIFLYFLALADKIARPNFKNLPYEDYGWIGLVVLVLIVIDILILRKQKGNNR